MPNFGPHFKIRQACARLNSNSERRTIWSYSFGNHLPVKTHNIRRQAPPRICDKHRIPNICTSLRQFIEQLACSCDITKIGIGRDKLGSRASLAEQTGCDEEGMDFCKRCFIFT
uniref:Uncharacterized protein n=1 Tax=Opuntia streptacantha TaxID=393608 RepID=A0A7C8Z5L9_OPUST